MNEVNSIWIAAYDIQNVRCLNKVSRLLLACMQRVQKSVFVGQIDEAMAKSLYNNIIRFLSDGDCFLLYPLCKKDIKEIKTFGIADHTCFQNNSFFIL